MSSTRPSATGRRVCGRLGQLGADLVLAARDIDPVDLGARRHHFAHGPVGEPHDAGDDRALLFLDDAVARRLRDDELQFLGGHMLARLALDAQQLEEQSARPVEEPDQRRGDPREPHHGGARDHRERLGIAQRILLGRQLAHDQRHIGREDDRDGEAQILGRFRLDAQQRDIFAERPAQLVAGNAPASTAMPVMPICTVERKRPGSADRSSAGCAPRRPALAIACRRGRRDETIASSDMANRPLMTINASTMTRSSQGKGRQVGWRGHGGPSLLPGFGLRDNSFGGSILPVLPRKQAFRAR